MSKMTITLPSLPSLQYFSSEYHHSILGQQDWGLVQQGDEATMRWVQMSMGQILSQFLLIA